VGEFYVKVGRLPTMWIFPHRDAPFFLDKRAADNHQQYEKHKDCSSRSHEICDRHGDSPPYEITYAVGEVCEWTLS
jgi:hypothetical protein